MIEKPYKNITVIINLKIKKIRNRKTLQKSYSISINP